MSTKSENNISAKTKAKCEKCKHYMKNTGCSGCVTAGVNKVKDILSMGKSDVSIELEPTEKEIEESFKYSCRVVINSPADFEIVQPFGKCKFFLHTALSF